MVYEGGYVVSLFSSEGRRMQFQSNGQLIDSIPNFLEGLESIDGPGLVGDYELFKITKILKMKPPIWGLPCLLNARMKSRDGRKMVFEKSCAPF
ncbi:MAG: hypothetical protein ACI9CP_000955 [Cryomorphaceae bacterium]|jgi:hypothetical protein